MINSDYLFKANLCIILDQNNELKIIKNRWRGETKYLNYKLAFDLISKILSNTAIESSNDILKLFSKSIQEEILDACNKIYKKYEVRNGNNTKG